MLAQAGQAITGGISKATLWAWVPCIKRVINEAAGASAISLWLKISLCAGA
jgi:hypothetical protein